MFNNTFDRRKIEGEKEIAIIFLYNEFFLYNCSAFIQTTQHNLKMYLFFQLWVGADIFK